MKLYLGYLATTQKASALMIKTSKNWTVLRL